MKTVRAADVDGVIRYFTIGDSISFKCDVEQSSEITAVRRSAYGVAAVRVNVTEGGYPHGETWIDCDRCW
jgi:hypothetical protein